MQLLGLCALVSVVLVLSVPAAASGHGPAFGLSTPTNVKGGFSLDLGYMGRAGRGDSSGMLRGMLAYGVTEDFQISFSAPVMFNHAALPPGRVTHMMAATPDLEGIAAWRFHRQAPAIGTRFESTAYLGLLYPGPQLGEGVMSGLKRAPGVYTAVATGMASRGHYVWGGLSYTYYAESAGDRRPPQFSYSTVWGYRPAAWRKDYPAWDWRWFVELVGEKSGRVRHGGISMAETGGHQLFLGPSVLGILKDVAVQGGVQFPVYRDTGTLHVRERARVMVNFSYFF